MRDRLEILSNLLSDDGSIWITIDDNEAHYLKVLCDEVFQRRNFIANVVWQKRTSPEARVALGAAHDDMLVYAKDKSRLTLNRLRRSAEQEKNFKNPDNDPRGVWTSTDFTAQGWRPNQMYKIVSPTGVEFDPPPGRCWSTIESEYIRLRADNRLWFGRDGSARPRIKNFLSEMEKISAWTWWSNSEVGHNQEAKKEIIALFGATNAFDTPKPERLISRVLEIATNPGELVLDSFAGSGTTGAVAQKMGRRWIMVELGDHAKTHIVPRMNKVIDGQDMGGVTEATDWKGGGGYRFCRLAPSLLEKDQWGNWVISKGYNAAMLTEAMCKHFNYAYAPSPEHYWMQGHSSESAFIFVTTNSLTFDQLRAISDEVGDGRSLLICCTAYESGAEKLANLTLRKIPQAVLSSCEWGKDDYSLKIEALPMMSEDEGDDDVSPSRTEGKGKIDTSTGDLFADTPES